MTDTTNVPAEGSQPGDDRLNRRLFFVRGLAGIVTATLVGTAATVVTPELAAAQRRRVTDSDPSDLEGRGRGWQQRPRRRAVTDNDPYDAAGAGRGWRQPVRRRSVTDSDPYDRAGRGRG